MEGLAGEIKALVYVAGPFVALIVWLVRMEGLAKGNRDRGLENQNRGRSAFKKIDSILERLALAEKRVEVHGDLLKPDKLAEHYTRTATFETETRERMATLRRDLDKLETRVEASRNGGS